MIPHSKDAEMREHLESWHQSGQSQSQYCKRHGIAVHQFSYYKRKLGYMFESPDNTPSQQLVPVSLKAEDTLSAPITIAHHNGFRIEVSANTDYHHLQKILMLVKQV